MSNFPALAPADDDVQFKEAGLQMLQILTDTLLEATEDAGILGDAVDGVLAGPLHALADVVCSRFVGAGSLFPDWSPLQCVHEVNVPVDEDTAVADSERKGESDSNQSFLARFAVDGNPSTFWSGESGRKSSVWTARLTKPSLLTSIDVTWKNDRGKPCAPVRVDVELSVDGSTYTTVASSVVADAIKALRTPLPSDSVAVLNQRIPVFAFTASYIRLKLTDLCAGSSGYHGIAAVIPKAKDLQRLHSATRDTLATLEALAHRTALSTVCSPDITTLALKCLQGISLTTGSLSALLKLLEVLLSDKFDKKHDAQLTDQLVQFVHQFRSAATEAFERAGGGEVATIMPKFDPDVKSSGIALSEDDTLCTSSGSSKNHVYGTRGFRTGRVCWEFTPTRDSNGDECSCFGCGTKPVVSGAYDGSSNLWMIRAYNGSVYTPGGSSSRPAVTKIHQGDIARFELDCDAGTVRLLVNSVDQGIVFSGLQGLEIFPVVCTYGDRRSVKFLKLEADGVVAGKNLLTQTAELRYSGAFTKDSNLPSGKPITVNGNACNVAMSMAPSQSGEACTVAYHFEEGSVDCIVGRVTVDDSTPEDPLTRPVVFEVRGEDDDEVLYRSPPLVKPGDSYFFRAFLGQNPGVVLQSVLEVEDSDSTLPVASVVVLDARTVSARSTPVHRSTVKVAEPSSDKFHASIVEALLDTLTDLAQSQAQFMNEAAVSVSRLAQRPPGGAVPAGGKDPFAEDEANLKQLLQLQSPLCIDVCADTFVRLESLLRLVMTRLQTAAQGGSGAAEDSAYTHIARALLVLVKLNLRRLVLSGVNPDYIGIAVAAPDGSSVKDKSLLTLTPLHRVLQAIMDAPSASIPQAVQIAAGDAVDAGLSVLYPTPEDRKELLSTLISKGGVLEVQFKFPTYRAGDADKKKDSKATPKRDLRFDRALLLLQVECETRGFQCTLMGHWNNYLHLIIALPEASTSAAGVDLVDAGFASVFKRAGFGAWTVPMGCVDPPVSLKIERYANFKDPSRNFSEDGAGVVRLYPPSAGTYEDIIAGVKSLPTTIRSDAPGGNSSSASAAAAAVGGASAVATPSPAPVPAPVPAPAPSDYSGFSFGSSAPTSGGGGGGLFSHSVASSGLGQREPSSSGSLFGSGLSFGAAPAMNVAPSGGMFGAPAAFPPLSASESPFGSSSGGGGGGGFGSGLFGAPPPSSSSVFGSAQPGSLFGSAQPRPFGAPASDAPARGPPSFSFGTFNAAPSPSSPFGSPSGPFGGPPRPPPPTK